MRRLYLYLNLLTIALVLVLIVAFFENNKKINTLLEFNQTQKNEKQTVVLMGSSVTHGLGATSSDKSWAGLLEGYYLEGNSNTNYINLGINGYTSQDIINNSLQIIKSLQPDIIILENCLINDFHKGFTTKQSEDNISHIMNTLKAIFPRTNISIMPPNDILVNSKNKEGLSYQQYVNKVGKFIKSHGWNYIDFWGNYNERLKQDGLTLAETINTDQIHPNDLGYKIWFESIMSVFK